MDSGNKRRKRGGKKWRRGRRKRKHQPCGAEAAVKLNMTPRGNVGRLKYLLWLTVGRGHPVCVQFYQLIATAPPLWNKWRLRNQTRLTNTMYKFVCFVLFFSFRFLTFFFFLLSSVFVFRHCTSIVNHIHQSIELWNILILIYKYIW